MSIASYLSQLLNSSGLVPVGKINATGTPGASNFLRGDGAWQTPSGGFSNMSVALYGSAINSSGSSLVWNSNGNLTWTVPTGITQCKVTVVGGGASGCYAYVSGANIVAGGGGAGGASIRYVTGLTPGGTVTVTVGAGGASAGTGGATTVNGNAGGTSSFGAYASATGGTGGISSIVAPWQTGGAGGTGSSGTFNIQGGYGSSGAMTLYSACVNAFPQGGNGGNGIFGGGGTTGTSTVTSGRANTGGGGAGVNASYIGNSGAGGSGVVIIEY
jgi:hypothetical protein